MTKTTHMRIAIFAGLMVLAMLARAEEEALPATTTDTFCAVVQRVVANTDIRGELTVFDEMGEFRASKPAPRPLTNSQYVTYDEARRPKMISCKVKSADHLVAEYGEGAAGPQGTCRDISERIVEMLIERLEIEDPSLANVARAQVVVEPDEPFVTGASWLSEFPLTFRGDDGRLHVNTQSLQVDWEDWRWYILPDRFRGQTYCHLIAPEHLEALLRSDGG